MKKRIIKLIAAAAVLAMLVSLAGCGKDTGKKDQGSTATVATGGETVDKTATDTGNAAAGTDTAGTEAQQGSAAGADAQSGADAQTGEGAKTAETGEAATGALYGNGVFSDDYINRVLDAYLEFMKGYFGEKDSDRYYTGRFFMGLINGDNIPELLIATGSETGEGVEVYSYMNGEVISVGNFGEFGSITYSVQTGEIFSFYSTYAADGTVIDRMTADGGYENIGENCVYYEDENCTYSINGRECSAEEYNASNDRLFADFNYVEYANMTAWDAFCFSDEKAVLRLMYEKLVAGEVYYGYFPEETDRLIGEWELVDFTLNDPSRENPEEHFDASWASASLEITDDYHASFWFSGYYDGGDAFYCEYYMPMFYMNTSIYPGCPNEDYCIRFTPEFSENKYYMTTCEKDGEELIHLCLFPDSDTGDEDRSILMNLRQRPPFDGWTYTGELSCSEYHWDEEYFIFDLVPYEIITADDDDELKARYGLEPDLDGYDYEIVKSLDSGELKVRLDSDCNAKFSLINYDDGMPVSEEVSMDEFLAAVEEAPDGLFVSIDVDINLWICRAEEMYIG